MGCHTWCYAHIPEKEQEWEEKLIELSIKDNEEYISLLENQTEFEWISDLENVQRYRKEYLEDYKNSDPGEKKEYLKYFNNSEEELLEYCTKYSDFTPDMLKEEYISCVQRSINSLKTKGINGLESSSNIIGTSDSNKFDYIIENGKIYLGLKSKYKGENIFPDCFYGDNLFRIHNYDASNCHSYQETIDVMNANKDTLEIFEDSDKLIKKFWETYPNGLIYFG